MFTLFLLDMVFPLQLLVLQCQLCSRTICPLEQSSHVFYRDGCSSRVRFTKYEQKKKRGHFAKKTKRPLLLLMADIHQVLMSHPIKDFQWMFFLNKLHGNGHVLKVFLHDVFALR